MTEKQKIRFGNKLTTTFRNTWAVRYHTYDLDWSNYLSRVIMQHHEKRPMGQFAG